MQPSSNNDNQAATTKKLFLNLFQNKILLQYGLIIGIVTIFLLLTKGSDFCIAAINSCNDSSGGFLRFLALGGSAAVLCGLTLMGVPLLPAVGAALSVWLLIEASFS